MMAELEPEIREAHLKASRVLNAYLVDEYENALPKDA
jgi:hypothetical protein